MKRLFHLIIVTLAATALFSGCQKYDDTQIRQEIKALGDRVAALEAWTRNSQEAVDYVAVLKEAVKNMRSIESVDVFEDEHGSGYVITFTNKQTIRLYNGKDGDTFFGKVNVGTSCVEFILADGTSFIVDRVTSSISFDSFEKKAVTKGYTVWTVMDENFKKEDFAAFTAELKTDDGTVTTIATKSATDGNPWKIEAVAPEFGEDDKLVKPAGVLFKETPQVGSKGVLRVALITNDGKESAVSIVVEAVPNYLVFEAVEAGATVSMKIAGKCKAPSLEYSTDLDEWNAFDFGNQQTITLKNVGDRVYWRNTGKAESFSKNNENYVHFVLGEKKIAAKGNIMSLVDNSCQSLTIPADFCFEQLFLGCASLTETPELPATSLSASCYYAMFAGCESLKEAPELPAIELSSDCYHAMFAECKSLEKASALPALNLAESCYTAMFQDCSSLKNAPALPAIKLARNCYCTMFYGCTSLTEAPILPATDLTGATYCYRHMFNGCKSLEKAPELPATKLATACYVSMFENCTSLKKSPALPAIILTDDCYNSMFYECESLEEAPELPATELAKACYYGMFNNCVSLTRIPSSLPATKLTEDCYGFMFDGCKSLEKAPALPATELAPNCYYVMFAECPSLNSAPELPATKLAENCYGFMFGYSGLTKAPELPATELAPGCYYAMLSGCYELEKAPELPAKKLEAGCYESMFDDCPKLNYIKVGFEDWHKNIGATAGWVVGVASDGTFECPDGLEVKYGDSFIPSGWSVNDASPVATKSFAAPAAKFTSGSHRKPLASKTPEIPSRFIDL